MADFWEYYGQAGKRLDVTRRAFEVDRPRLSFPALSIDRLTYAITLADLVPGEDEIIPEQGQSLTVLRNGVRFFTGTVLLPEQSDYEISVTVEGPWSWLEKEPLTSAVNLDAASGGGTGTGVRPTIGFPQQSMTTSLGTLLARMVALGAPFTVGTIPTTFACIPVTLNQGNMAQALTECLRLIGDMTAAFDYSGSGLPVLNITRRLAGITGSATAVTLDVGELAGCSFRIVPQDQLRVSQVRVPYLDRAPNGLRRYQEKKAGTAEAGHVLLLTASGEELDTFLPDEKLDSVQLQTLATNASDAAWLAYLNTRDSVLNQLRQNYGNEWWGGNIVGLALGTLALADANGVEYHNSPPTSTSVPQVFHGITKTFKVNGQPIAGVKHAITTDASVPEWLQSQNGITIEEGEMSVDVVLVIQHKASGYTPPQGIVDFEGYGYYERDGYNVYGATTYPRIMIRAYPVTIPVKLIGSSYPALTTVYRQPDYTFIGVPNGFPEGLLAARNWTPHSGPISWKEQECGERRYLGKVINVTGADPSFATMRAMVQAEELDLDTGTTTLQLGPPARLAFPSLLDAVRTNSNQQITYL